MDKRQTSKVWILILSITYLNSSSVHCEFTYEEGEWETMIVDLITRSLAFVPIEDFVDDPELTQKVDRVNKLSLYLATPTKSGKDVESEVEPVIVYRRSSVDFHEPIVVLRSREDNLKVFKRKRTFVALRQNPFTNNTYFTSYVYLR
jgi:hypothetical protein